MTITNDFVFIHFPKNAGAFVTSCLESLYDKTSNKNRPCRLSDKLLYLINKEKTNYCNLFRSKDVVYNGKLAMTQHQSCRDIPKKHQRKAIVSCVRNPFDRYVSIYKSGWWKKKNNVHSQVKSVHFSRFPDLTFKEYMDFSLQYDMEALKQKVGIQLNIGSYSLQFLKMYAKNPRLVMQGNRKLENLDSNDFYDVKFLTIENVANDLLGFLTGLGWPEEKVKAVLNENAIAGSHPNVSYREYYDQNLINKVREQDAFLFRLFPEYTF